MSGITNGAFIGDGELSSIHELARGQFDADLGGMTFDEVQARGRPTDQIADDVVQTAIDRVRGSGVLELGLKWRMEDGYDPSRGGRKVDISAEAVLTAFMLLARENSALLIRDACRLLQFRLSETMRRELSLPARLDWVVTRHAAVLRWEENFRSTLHRHILDPMDPYPAERHRAKTYEEIQQILDAHDAEREILCRSRLDEFMRRFIAMTYGQQPRNLRRRSSTVDLSIDQTPMAPPTRRGFDPKKLAAKVAAEKKATAEGRALMAGPTDPFAGWYPMNGERADFKRGEKNDLSPANPGNGKDVAWGWALNVGIRMDSASPSAPRFPKLIAAATLSMPLMGASEEAVTVMRHALHEGLVGGIVDGDMAYFANATVERLHRPTRELGYTPSTEYRIDRLGRNQGADVKGGILFIDGAMLCPGTPAYLQTAGLDHAEHRIDDATFHQRRVRRRSYEVHVKEKTNERGKFRVVCPARGSAPTVTCPLVELSKKAAVRKPGEERPEVEDSDVPEFLDSICAQHAITLDADVNLRYAQAHEYGSPEWQAFHSAARQSIESVNKGLKEDHLDSLKTPGRRRVRGFVAAAFFATILIVNYNLRQIATFMHDELLTGAHGPAKVAKSRYRDAKFYNTYTGTTPTGLRVPESIEQRGTRPRRRTKGSARNEPIRT